MTKEENLTIPRWFLEIIENTLRIQNNINLDKETGETCQDRNIRQSLNGVRKLLKGEELTGMERLEKLQPSLPSNFDEAAEEQYPDFSNSIASKAAVDAVRDAFKAGAEWMAGQGKAFDGVVRDNGMFVDFDDYGSSMMIPSNTSCFNNGDEVIVQIRKKQ